MDVSREQPKTTAGLDIGDKYSYLYLLDQESGEIIEEGRLITTPEALRRRFASEPSLRIAIETGTHSPWVSRVLEECDHEVLVANARKLRLIYANKRKTDEVDAENLGDAWHASIRSSCTHSGTVARTPRPTWPSSARVRLWWIAARSSWTTSEGRSSPSVPACPSALQGASTRELKRAHPRGACAGS
jgi:hypothetical protein